MAEPLSRYLPEARHRMLRERRADWEAHLKSCPRCAKWVEDPERATKRCDEGRQICGSLSILRRSVGIIE